VAFYEHVFDVARAEWSEIIPWIPPDVEQGCWPLWEIRLSPDNVARLRKAFALRREGKLEY
jgi:hypothetical protein